MTENPDDLRRRQARWIERHADLMGRPVPIGQARHIARLVADTIAVAWHARAGNIGATAVDDVGLSDGPVSVWGSAAMRGISDAAFLNGCAAEVLDFQEVLIDGRNNGHAAVVIVPSLVAIASARSLDPDRLCRGLRVAFAANVTLARALGRGHRSAGPVGTPGFRTTSVVSPIAAALGGALMLGADVEAAGHAVAIAAANLPAGLLAAMAPTTGDFSMDKDISVGLSARHVVQAVQLAANGATGPRAVLEGPRGWLASFGFATEEPSRLDADPEAVDLSAYTIKLFPANFGCQCAIRLAIDLAGDLPVDRIDRVTIKVKSSSAASLSVRQLRTHAAARFSLAYAVASALLRKRAVLADYEPSAYRDPKVLALMERVDVVGDDELEARHHADGIFPARLQVSTTDGTVLEHKLDRLFDGMDDSAIDGLFSMKIRDLCPEPVAAWLLGVCANVNTDGIRGFLSAPNRATSMGTLSRAGRVDYKGE